MFASFEYKDININSLRYCLGYNGYVGNMLAILCQRQLFPYSNNEGFIAVEFEKPLKEVYIDTDDSEAYDIFKANRSTITWAELIKEDADEYMYGAYVKEVNSTEIINIYHCLWDPEAVGRFDFWIEGIEYSKFMKAL